MRRLASAVPGITYPAGLARALVVMHAMNITTNNVAFIVLAPVVGPVQYVYSVTLVVEGDLALFGQQKTHL